MLPWHDTLVPGEWTVALLPDLQNYTGYGENVRYLHDMLEWIIAEKDRLGIRLVLQVGDLTNRNEEKEWQRARAAFRLLDGKLPYVLTVGNHDLGRGSVGASRWTRLNDFMRPGDNPINASAFVAFHREGCLENTASVFDIEGREWLILALEFGPRDDVLTWAQTVLGSHPDKPVILVTHEFIDQLSYIETGLALHSGPNTHNSPLLYGLASETGGANCGVDVWERLVEPNSQIRLVVNGHYRPYQRDSDGKIIPVDDIAETSRVDRRRDGSVVHQQLFNAQWAPNGGDGWLYLMRFDSAGQIRTGKSLSARRSSLSRVG